MSILVLLDLSMQNFINWSANWNIFHLFWFAKPILNILQKIPTDCELSSGYCSLASLNIEFVDQLL